MSRSHLYYIIFMCNMFLKGIQSNNVISINCTSICNQVEMAYENNNLQCDVDCRRYNCITGCTHWRQSSNSSCQDICQHSSGWHSGNNIGCTLGCVFATQSYMDNAKDQIGAEAAPQLIGGTITSSSMGLRWEGTDEIPGVKYLIQFRKGAGTGEWHYYNPEQLLSETQIYVKDLRPFTKHQFRVAWIIVPNQPPLLSTSSPWISTLPSGAPQSPPRNVRAVPLDWHRIEVSWDPPYYPGGDLISYTLYMEEENGDSEVRKDIEATADKRLIVSELLANTTYELRLSATNHNGEGPSAILNVSTYPKAAVIDDGRGYLLLSSGSGLLELSTDIMEQPKYVFNTSSGNEIAGLAVHIPLKFVYISDANGTVYQIHIKTNAKISHRVLLTPGELGGQAYDLSSDWLFGFLYIVVSADNFKSMEDWQIWRCDLLGKHLKLVAQGLPFQPKYLAADPYNGYLWWIADGDGVESGLHRLPLNYDSEATEMTTSAVIHRDKHLGAFTLDAPNFRVLIADQLHNTVLAVSLDGTSVNDLRSNTQQAFFNNVTSLALLSGKFFWTSGKEVYAEELNEGTFYHNSFALLGSGVFSHLIAMHRSAQPIPVPLNSPRQVQALFTRTSATITWTKPQIPALTGVGAWQDWKYEVHIQEGQKIIYKTNLNSTELVVSNLVPSTSYDIKVRAYSKSGEGPWGTVFKGQTLSYWNNDSRILWVTEDDFISTDIDGRNSEVIVIPGHKTKNSLLGSISHVSYYRDSIIVSYLNKGCHLVNLTTGSTVQLPGMSGVYATAIDWATHRVFGVHPKNNTIVWSHLDGFSHGILEVLTVGLQLEIDSFRGLLYWRTRYGVFKGTLTGRNITQIHQENIFSGKLVQSISLDAQTSTVWWIVRDENGCHLFRHNENLAKLQPVLLPYSVMEGSMNYVSERLVWLSDEGELIIYDPTHQSSAVVKSRHLNVSHIAVKFVPLLSEEDGIEGLLPGAINPLTIQTSGSWKNFSITWEPLYEPSLESLREKLKIRISNPFNVDLRYEVSILGAKERATFVTSESKVILPWFVDPYSPLTVMIRAITHWGIGRNSVTELRSPSDLPSAPTRLRVYKIEQDEEEKVILRWDSPMEPRGLIEKYKIDFFTNPELDAEMGSTTYVNASQKLEQEYKLSVIKNTTFIFRVSAFTYLGEGPTASLEVNLDDETLAIIPSLLVAGSSSARIMDVDSGRTELILANTTINYVALGLAEKSLLWMNNHSDVFRRSMNDARQETNRLLRLDGVGRDLAFDWIGEIVYWLEDDNSGNKWVKAYDINYKTFRSIYQYAAAAKENPVQIIASPINNVLYIVVERSLVRTVMVHPLNGSKPYDLFDDGSRNLPNHCTCPKNPSLSGDIALDTSSLGAVRLYVSLKETTFEGHQKSSILSSDSFGCSCTLVALLQDFGYDSCDTMAVDGSYLYCLASTSNSLLWMRKEGPTTIKHFYKRSIDDVTSILPLSANTQPMPSLKCLFVSRHNEKPVLSLSQETSLTLSLPLPRQSTSDCGLLSLPPWMNHVYYARISNVENVSSCATNINMCSMIRSQNSSIVISDLEPFTKYVFRVAFETTYNSKFKIPIQPGPPTIFKTKAKAPKGASSVSATAISPKEIKVSFKVPTITSFEIHWRNHKGEKGFSPLTYTSQKDQLVTVVLRQFNPDSRYEIWVRIYSVEDQDLFTDSPRVVSVTYPEPPPISLLQRNPQSLEVQWTAPFGTNILRHSIEYKADYERKWSSTPVELTVPGTKYPYNLENLKSASSYELRLVFIYNTTEHNTFVWPVNNPFTFNTSGDIPGAPGVVRIQQTEGGWEARWAHAEANGSPILAYELQMATLTPAELTENNFTFVTVYNDTANFWDVTSDFNPTLIYMFRARGINSLGEGAWSNPSNTRSPVGASMMSTVHLPTILGATLPSCLMFFAVLLTCLTVGIRRADNRRRKAKAEVAAGQVPHRSRELELATVPHLPNNNNFISENNILYNMQSFSSDDIDLPRISQNCISLTKFLGSGAFGEVYEGSVTKLPGRTGAVKVAIKTLRKGATEHEKCEFLKEAQLMSHFQHDHILRLLAVCTDHDPFYLILELMEGGDLLSYLRANRAKENGFTLLDLLNMCVDVAKGCVYLEDMHFVHRDLAARNCLVSSTNPSQRIVKIGDFGLARDIYKNDYYRKEGEGLLPVRWMSPESLIDGVFTTHSDVWAFGVLLWEIMTLGQQPYPARTNLEVLHYVRSGGKPSRPPNCPEDLNNLTQSCWSYNPEVRPTFKECLNVLLVLEETVASLPSLNVHNVQYMSSNRFSGLDNLAYATDRDESKNSDSSTLPLRDNSWNNMRQCTAAVLEESTSGASTIPMTAPLHTQQQYLQLVDEVPYHSEPSSPRASTNCNFHSYEIPISSLQRRENDDCSLSTEFTSVASTSFQFENPLNSITSFLDKSSLLNSFATRTSINSTSVRSFASLKNANLPSIPGHSVDCEVPFVTRKNSLPSTFTSRHKWPGVSLPSSPRSPSQCSPFLSPSLDSPTTRITFTFPQEEQHNTWLPSNNYLHPINRVVVNSICEPHPTSLNCDNLHSAEDVVTLEDVFAEEEKNNEVRGCEISVRIPSSEDFLARSVDGGTSIFGKCHPDFESEVVMATLTNGVCS